MAPPEERASQFRNSGTSGRALIDILFSTSTPDRSIGESYQRSRAGAKIPFFKDNQVFPLLHTSVTGKVHVMAGNRSFAECFNLDEKFHDDQKHILGTRQRSCRNLSRDTLD